MGSVNQKAKDLYPDNLALQEAFIKGVDWGIIYNSKSNINDEIFLV